jgi:hypothetical protein
MEVGVGARRGLLLVSSPAAVAVQPSSGLSEESTDGVSGAADLRLTGGEERSDDKDAISERRGNLINRSEDNINVFLGI